VPVMAPKKEELSFSDATRKAFSWEAYKFGDVSVYEIDVYTKVLRSGRIGRSLGFSYGLVMETERTKPFLNELQDYVDSGKIGMRKLAANCKKQDRMARLH
jgi:hypothetical protein